MIQLADVSDPSFSGHETFPPRYGWLKKGIDQIRTDPEFFQRKDALTVLGVGKNMVSSIRHWVLTLGLASVDEAGRGRGLRLTPTDLGLRLFADDGWDPFLEYDGTLWILHWRLATAREAATTWWWAFHRPPTATIRREQLANELAAAGTLYEWRASWSTIKRDVDCFMRTYLPATRGPASPEDAYASPLASLGLIETTMDRNEYIISRGQQASLPDHLVVWAVENYMDLKYPDRVSGTLPLGELLFGAGSPGRTLCLNETSLIDRLVRGLSYAAGAWDYDETAGLQQLIVHRRLARSEILSDYYRMTSAPMLEARAS